MTSDSGKFRVSVFPIAVVAAVALGYAGLFFFGASLGSAVEGGEQKPEASPAYKPVAPLDVIMEHVDEGFGEMPAKIQKKQFRTVKKDSLFVAELINIAAHHETKEEWRQIAFKTRDLLVDLSKATDQKDEGKLSQMVETTNESCESCHKKFRD